MQYSGLCCFLAAVCDCTAVGMTLFMYACVLGGRGGGVCNPPSRGGGDPQLLGEPRSSDPRKPLRRTDSSHHRGPLGLVQGRLLDGGVPKIIGSEHHWITRSDQRITGSLHRITASLDHRIRSLDHWIA